MLKICKYGDPVLKKKAKPVKEIDEKIKKLISKMLNTMYAAPGIGLAANQVGVPIQLCVIDVKPEGKKNPLVLINPKIVYKKDKLYEEEGCLSFPGLMAKVKRYREVKVEAINERGLPVQIEATDLLSRALQHEIDHLNGKVFVDRLPFFTRLKLKRIIKLLKREGRW